MRARATAGFTLLEAIVALTIMAVALIPLVSFIAQSSDQLMRAGEANERSIVMQSVLALMDPVNPMAEPEGTLPLDDTINVSWTSETIAAPAEGGLVRTPLAGFRMGFYGVTVSVTRDQQPWFDFKMRKVGYQNLRQGAPGMFGGP
jgi:general secretion pathway protein I